MMNLKKELKKFPWLQEINADLYSAFGIKEECLQKAILHLYHNATEELKNVIKEKNYKKGSKLHNILNMYLCHLRMWSEMLNASCKVAFIYLLSCLIDIQLFLSRGDKSSVFLEYAVRNIFLCLGDAADRWDVVHHCSLMKKVNSEVCFPVLRRILQEKPDHIEDPKLYMKFISVVRMCKFFAPSKVEKIEVINMAAKVKVPDNLTTYLLSLGFTEVPTIPNSTLKIAKCFTQKFPFQFFKHLRRMLYEDDIQVISPDVVTTNQDITAEPNVDIFFVDSGSSVQNSNIEGDYTNTRYIFSELNTENFERTSNSSQAEMQSNSSSGTCLTIKKRKSKVVIKSKSPSKTAVSPSSPNLSKNLKKEKKKIPLYTTKITAEPNNSKLKQKFKKSTRNAQVKTPYISEIASSECVSALSLHDVEMNSAIYDTNESHFFDLIETAKVSKLKTVDDEKVLDLESQENIDDKYKNMVVDTSNNAELGYSNSKKKRKSSECNELEKTDNKSKNPDTIIFVESTEKVELSKTISKKRQKMVNLSYDDDSFKTESQVLRDENIDEISSNILISDYETCSIMEDIKISQTLNDSSHDEPLQASEISQSTSCDMNSTEMEVLQEPNSEKSNNCSDSYSNMYEFIERKCCSDAVDECDKNSNSTSDILKVDEMNDEVIPESCSDEKNSCSRCAKNLNTFKNSSSLCCSCCVLSDEVKREKVETKSCSIEKEICIVDNLKNGEKNANSFNKKMKRTPKRLSDKNMLTFNSENSADGKMNKVNSNELEIIDNSDQRKVLHNSSYSEDEEKNESLADKKINTEGTLKNNNSHSKNNKKRMSNKRKKLKSTSEESDYENVTMHKLKYTESSAEENESKFKEHENRKKKLAKSSKHDEVICAEDAVLAECNESEAINSNDYLSNSEQYKVSKGTKQKDDETVESSNDVNSDYVDIKKNSVINESESESCSNKFQTNSSKNSLDPDSSEKPNTRLSESIKNSVSNEIVIYSVSESESESDKVLIKKLPKFVKNEVPCIVSDSEEDMSEVSIHKNTSQEKCKNLKQSKNLKKSFKRYSAYLLNSCSDESSSDSDKHTKIGNGTSKNNDKTQLSDKNFIDENEMPRNLLALQNSSKKTSEKSFSDSFEDNFSIKNISKNPQFVLTSIDRKSVEEKIVPSVSAHESESDNRPTNYSPTPYAKCSSKNASLIQKGTFESQAVNENKSVLKCKNTFVENIEKEFLDSSLSACKNNTTDDIHFKKADDKVISNATHENYESDSCNLYIDECVSTMVSLPDTVTLKDIIMSVRQNSLKNDSNNFTNINSETSETPTKMVKSLPPVSENSLAVHDKKLKTIVTLTPVQKETDNNLDQSKILSCENLELLNSLDESHLSENNFNLILALDSDSSELDLGLIPTDNTKDICNENGETHLIEGTNSEDLSRILVNNRNSSNLQNNINNVDMHCESKENVPMLKSYNVNGTMKETQYAKAYQKCVDNLCSTVPAEELCFQNNHEIQLENSSPKLNQSIFVPEQNTQKLPDDDDSLSKNNIKKSTGTSPLKGSACVTDNDKSVSSKVSENIQNKRSDTTVAVMPCRRSLRNTSKVYQKNSNSKLNESISLSEQNTQKLPNDSSLLTKNSSKKNAGTSPLKDSAHVSDSDKSTSPKISENIQNRGCDITVATMPCNHSLQNTSKVYQRNSSQQLNESVSVPKQNTQKLTGDSSPLSKYAIKNDSGTSSLKDSSHLSHNDRSISPKFSENIQNNGSDITVAVMPCDVSLQNTSKVYQKNSSPELNESISVPEQSTQKLPDNTNPLSKNAVTKGTGTSPLTDSSHLSDNDRSISPKFSANIQNNGSDITVAIMSCPRSLRNTSKIYPKNSTKEEQLHSSILVTPDKLVNSPKIKNNSQCSPNSEKCIEEKDNIEIKRKNLGSPLSKRSSSILNSITTSTSPKDILGSSNTQKITAVTVNPRRQSSRIQLLKHSSCKNTPLIDLTTKGKDSTVTFADVKQKDENKDNSCNGNIIDPKNFKNTNLARHNSSEKNKCEDDYSDSEFYSPGTSDAESDVTSESEKGAASDKRNSQSAPLQSVKKHNKQDKRLPEVITFSIKQGDSPELGQVFNKLCLRSSQLKYGNTKLLPHKPVTCKKLFSGTDDDDDEKSEESVNPVISKLESSVSKISSRCRNSKTSKSPDKAAEVADADSHKCKVKTATKVQKVLSKKGKTTNSVSMNESKYQTELVSPSDKTTSTVSRNKSKCQAKPVSSSGKATNTVPRNKSKYQSELVSSSAYNLRTRKCIVAPAKLLL